MLHDDELPIDLSLVRRLVDRDVPHLAALPLSHLGSSGSTNALFALGEDLLVRLPRQPGGSQTIRKEARWLPYLAPLLPAPVPEVVAVGEPGFGYPEHWSVVRRLHGHHPQAAATTSLALAHDLATLVEALRTAPVPDEARTDPALRWYRGEPLVERDAGMRQNLEACQAISGLGLDLDACRGVWDDAMRLPPQEPQTHWYHGDLAAENLLVQDGLAAVLDFGGLSLGDPTIDLVAGWEVLSTSARDDFRKALAVDDGTWERARAWALFLAVMTFPYYWRTMPHRCQAQLLVARAVLADATT